MSVLMHKVYKISTEFSKTPGPRSICEGEFSGELFRIEHLVPEFAKAISEDYILVIDLDGTAGYGTSFLEEAFGGLIRNNKYSLSQIQKHIIFISNEESYLIKDIMGDLNDANKKTI